MTIGHGIAALVFAAFVAACGGSGSTGLVSPEGALLREVRRDGTCATSEEMVTYCATDSPDAVSPGGTSAAGPLDIGGPQRTATPGAAAPTPTPQPTASPAGGASPSPAVPTPIDTQSAVPTPTVQSTPCQTATGACPAAVNLLFVVRGLPEGGACAPGARPFGSDDAWSTGALVAAGGAVTNVEVALPSTVGPGLVEVALLCFEDRPVELPAQLPTLSAAAPDVVFVPADPVNVPAAGS